ncbi:MAG TPA: hypothetical protein VFS96_06590 [Nitrolancea sp.]|nr:hypothetical protein [Nitrolancea sp.]
MAVIHGRRIQRTWEHTPEEVIADGLHRLRVRGSTYRLVLAIGAILFVIGTIAIIIGPLRSGFANRQTWTYVAVAFGYLMATCASAPCLSVATRLARGHWRRPVNRISELWAATLIIPLILFFLLLLLQPSSSGRPSIWFGWPGSPWIWSSVLMIALVLTGYAFLYFSSLPDIAVARDHFENGRRGWFTRLAGNWHGTDHQWRTIERGVSYLGAFYVVLYVGTMTVIASDFILSFIPGNNSAIFPAYYTISSFQAGIALTIITAAILRRWGGAAGYLDLDQFFILGKLLLAFSLLYFYFSWTEFIVWWYGRTPREEALLKLLYFQTYFWPFAIAFVLNFVAPLLILMWTRVRRSITGPTVVAVLVLIGSLFTQIRLYSASFSPTNIYEHELHSIPPPYFPGLIDLLILAGMAGGAVALMLLALRVVAYPPIWEMIAGLRLRVTRRNKHGEVAVIGKPD